MVSIESTRGGGGFTVCMCVFKCVCLKKRKLGAEGGVEAQIGALKICTL